jgi:glucose/arabinose dehydrogenase
MSMAFHPSFGFDGEKRVYLSYTSGNADLNVAEAILDGDTLDVQNLQPFVSIPHPNGANRHFGAMIAFGRDGYLYLSSGDGEGTNGQQNGQNKSSILSAMLRLDVEDPATPVVGNIQDGDPRILHKGFRNPWRFSFDLGNGDMFLGDVGNSTEEINFAKAGSGPMNFLWPNDSGEGALFAYPTVNGAERAAVVGGYVYRGSQMPDMQGRYFFGDFERGDIYVLTYDGTKLCDKSTVWDEGKGTPVAFGQDAQGELYVMSWTGAPCPESNCPGEPGEDALYKIVLK